MKPQNEQLEVIKAVAVSGRCIWCKGKIFGMAETRDEAIKRLKFNLTQHQETCPEARGEFDDRLQDGNRPGK